MKCTNCGKELQEAQKFCPSCGQAVNATCPNCGEAIEGAEKFCGSCEYSLKAQDNVPKNTPISVPINAQNSSDGAEIKYPPEEAIKKLMEMNSEAKAAIVATIGARFLNKWLVPILRDGEKLIAVNNIQSKWLFARYRHECVVLTDQRVIKLEKLQYFKPKIESCELTDIQHIESDNPANVVSAAMIGEKIKIISSSGTLNMRMVGKGYAKKLEERIRNIPNEPGVYVSAPNGTENAVKTVVGKNGKRKWFGFLALTILLAILGFALLGNESNQEAARYISKVQNGYLGDYHTVTVGAVFGEMLSDGDWEGFSTDKDQIIVQYTTQDEKNKIQFMISEEGDSFTVVHMVYQGETMPQSSDCKIVLDSLYGEYFKNHPELGQEENASWDNTTTEGYFANTVVETKAIQTEEAFDGDISTLQAASSEEVAAFLKKAGILEEIEGYLYGDDDIVISLDDAGKIESVSIMSEQYSWYGMKVGEVFPVEQAKNVFEMYGYSLVLSYESQYFYAANSENALSPDGTIRIMLYDNQSIMEIDYMVTGAEEAWSSLAAADFMETTPAYEPYILPDSNTRYLSEDELAHLDKATLRLARNEIYARHGRQFKTEDLNEYFIAQPWYEGYISEGEFDDSVLNEYEKANLVLIKSIEDGTSVYAMPDYIVGSSTQLGVQNLYDITYFTSDGNIMMIITEDNHNGDSVRFSKDGTWLWEGSVDRFQTLENGGLWIGVEGYDYNEDVYDYVNLEWASVDDVNNCLIYHYDAVDYSGIDGNYVAAQ